MNVNKIYEGNCLEILKTFPDESINCCITSPPYYALRDYGTGKWVGGDPNCDHVADPNATTAGYYQTVCSKCGAVRVDSQIGLEETPEEYIKKLVDVFNEVRRCLTNDGTLWLNIGDTYSGSCGGRGTGYHDARTDVVQAGNKGFNDMMYAPKLTKLDMLKPKDLIGIPWMLAFALRESGWYLRQDIIWSKPNQMPESVKDRCTKSHEYIFLLTKSAKYYYDYEAIQEMAIDPIRRDDVKKNSYDGKRNFTNNKINGSFSFHNGKRNKRSVWTVIPAHYKEAHFATFPEELVYPMLLAGCPKGGIVLDPFMGSGTVGAVAKENHRNYIGIDLNPEYIEMAERRIKNTMRKLF